MKIKNDKDARKYAKKILSKKYGKHEIDSSLHVVGSNNWEIKAHAKELEITLFLDQETGETLGKPITLRKVTREIIEDPITISDKISRVLKQHFTKTHWSWLITSVCLTVSGSVISAFFDPSLGITTSLIFGGLSIIYGKFAFTQHTVIDRG